MINIRQLRPTQSLRELNENRVEFYKGIIFNRGYVAEIVVTQFNGCIFIIDGHHRFLAFVQMGVSNVPCRFINVHPNILNKSQLYDWEDVCGFKLV